MYTPDPHDDMTPAMRSPRLFPRLLCLLTALTMLAPPRAQAAPAEEPQALAVFEAGFKDGQAKFDGGQFLAAARTWIAAATNLSEKLSNRDNRVAVYEYVVDAFTSGLQGVQEVAALREAAEALDAYCDGFLRAYGTETPISAKITAARDDFKRRLADAEAAQVSAGPGVEGPVVDPEPLPPPVDPSSNPRKWKGLVIAGGVMTGVGVLMGSLAAFQGARGKQLENEYLAKDCRTMMTPKSMDCQDLTADGKASNTGAIGGAVLAVPLLAVGVTLLVIGLKRKAPPRTSFTPMLAPGSAGFSLQGSF